MQLKFTKYYDLDLMPCVFSVNLPQMYSVSQKNPPEDLWQFFQSGWEFFNQILHAYFAFLSTLDYEFLFNYLQL